MKSAYIRKSPFLALSLRELMMMKDSGYPMSAYDVDPSIMPLLGLPHRQFVFTLPKALRVFLRYDQHLFGELSRLMYSIGQDQNLLGLDNTSLGTIQLTKGNGIDADPDTSQTSVAGVFAGGDVVTGPATAVEAIAAGRKAAMTIAGHLSGRKVAKAVTQGTVPETLRAINDGALKRSERVSIAEVAPSKRCMDSEDYVTLDEGKVSIEAHRCLDCSCVAVNASDVAPALVALGATIKTTKRSIAAEDFFTVSLMTTTVLAVDELVTDIFIPSPRAGTRFSFQKFRVRNSIDFPIVSVASALTFDGAKIKEARIVFGAVAPIPLRAANVEEALVGRTANEETAELAENTATTPSLCPT